MPERRLIVVKGEEGAGKSTIIRALLPHTPSAARIDAEDIGQTNPCPMDDGFFALLRHNVALLVDSFWRAGYVNVSIRQATGADYRYVGVETSHLDVATTVARVKAAIPEVYAA